MIHALQTCGPRTTVAEALDMLEDGHLHAPSSSRTADRSPSSNETNLAGAIAVTCR
jgi:hypothetical protein